MSYPRRNRMPLPVFKKIGRKMKISLLESNDDFRVKNIFFLNLSSLTGAVNPLLMLN